MTSAAVIGLVPVHIGQPQPGSEQEQMLLVQLERRRDRSDRERLPRVPGGLDWQTYGLQPRWLGMETSDCVVAIEPGFFHNRGADERDRFLAGARRRGELALVIAIIGDADDEGPRCVLSRFDSSVRLSSMFTSVDGRRLPAGTRPEIADGLDAADRDLAMRLLNRPADAPWWTLQLSGARVERGDGSGSTDYEPEGQLHPILVDALGEPVVAAWTPSASDQRWYVIPDATAWDSILDWLMHRGLPEYVPDALRRARSPHFVDPDLQTADELIARRALDELEGRYVEEKLRLEQDLRDARARAEPVRYGLLYGSGAELVRAVAAVLTAAGLSVVDLDQALGGTKSADLLVGTGGSSLRLVEVKAVGGPASEQLVGHLQRHLETWPQLRPDQPVTGGVLIVNHQHKLHPSERTEHVYSRPEFVAALPVTVLSTVELFRWWRTMDWTAVCGAVSGVDASSASTKAVLSPATASEATSPPSRWRLWRSVGRG